MADSTDKQSDAAKWGPALLIAAGIAWWLFGGKKDSASTEQPATSSEKTTGNPPG